MLARNVLRVSFNVSRGFSAPICCRQAFYSTDKKGYSRTYDGSPRKEKQLRYYTKKHEWVSVTNNIGTVGISSYAQEALGEVVFVQLPDVGLVLSAGDESGALESVKAASEVYTPVSGTVTEKNTAAESTPSLINKSCYDEGWLFRIKLSQLDDLKNLMDQPTYDKYLQESH